MRTQRDTDSKVSARDKQLQGDIKQIEMPDHSAGIAQALSL
jgi:hypothetical protein